MAKGKGLKSMFKALRNFLKDEIVYRKHCQIHINGKCVYSSGSGNTLSIEDQTKLKEGFNHFDKGFKEMDKGFGRIRDIF